MAVDDAGAGYASFAQLLRLRPDIIKIDGELIAGIDHDPVKRALATALTSLASELKAKLVAEAVETASQLNTLVQLGIEYGQGFHPGLPQPAI
jgi:EAL domain-containing protein (putative c-di-GMP-specific phosphodiesterase class I)